MKLSVVILITFFILSYSQVYSQNSNLGKAVIALEEQDYRGAFEAVNNAVDPENPKAKKTINSTRAWILRGEILTEIGRVGIRNITYEPLFEAYSSFQKAIELDTKKRKSYQLIPDLKALQEALSTYGKNAYNQQRYKIASRSFLTYMEIQKLPYLESFQDEELDTVITYNAGLAAFEAQEWDLVIEYFGLAERDGCITPVGYYCKAIAYQGKDNSEEYLDLLISGNEMFPQYDKITNEIISYYIQEKSYTKALPLIDDMLSKNSSDMKLWMLKGNIMERLNKEEEAIDIYKKTIEMAPTEYTPLYNLGVIYYNNGVDRINAAIELPEDQNEQYINMMETGNEQLELCLPYFEKAYALNPSEKNILKSLSFIYKQLEMTEKHEEAERKLKI